MASKNRLDSKKVISIILAFVLSIVLASATLLVGIRGGLLSKQSVNKAIKDSNYNTGLHSYILEEIEFLSTPMGIPITIIEEVFTEQKVSEDVASYFKAKLNNEVPTLNTDTLANTLEQKVKDYLTSQNIKMSSEQENTLKTYISDIKDEYNSLLKMPFIDQFVKVQTLYAKLLYPVVLGLIIFAGIIVVLMKKLQRWKHRFYRYVTYSTIAAVLMSGIIPASLLISQIYKKIALNPQYFYNFIMSYIGNGLMTMLMCSLIWVIVSVWLLLQVVRYKAIAKHKHR